MKLKVTRSPAKVSWWVMYGDSVVATCDTKHEANAVAESLAIKWRLNYETLSPVA